MNRYLVFKYTPGDGPGGWHEFASAHADLGSAKFSAQKVDRDCTESHVVDLETLEIITELYYWSEGHMMVTEQELDKVRKQKEDLIAEIQRNRGLIA